MNFRQETQVLLSHTNETLLNRAALNVTTGAQAEGAVVSGPIWYGLTVVLAVFAEGSTAWLMMFEGKLNRLARAGSEVCTVTSFIMEKENVNE